MARPKALSDWGLGLSRVPQPTPWDRGHLAQVMKEVGWDWCGIEAGPTRGVRLLWDSKRTQISELSAYLALPAFEQGPLSLVSGLPFPTLSIS